MHRFGTEMKLVIQRIQHEALDVIYMVGNDNKSRDFDIHQWYMLLGTECISLANTTNILNQ